MAYIALARKYRPRRFEDFVGQEPIARTLRNAIAQDKVSHAYIFAGSRGIGKTSMARVFAMALNCQASDKPTVSPCGECDICRDIQAGQDLDVQELDGASNNGVDHVRALRENARFAPNRARWRIYYIDEAHMLSAGAFNALLKTLEEPPGHVKFILSTTAASKIPETIHSRSQRFDFRRISAADIVRRLTQVCASEAIEAEADALALIARRARGSMRDALSLLDQAAAFCEGPITSEQALAVLGGLAEEDLDALLETVRTGDVAGALRAAGRLMDAGADPPDVLEQVAAYARALLLAAECGPQADLLERAQPAAERLHERSAAFAPEFLMYAVQVLYEARRKARQELDGRTVMELALVKLARAQEAGGLENLIGRLEALEARIGAAGEGAAPAGRVRERTGSYLEDAPARRSTPPTAAVAPDGPVAAPESWADLLTAVNGRLPMLTAGHLSRCRLLERSDDRLRLGVPEEALREHLSAPEEHAGIVKVFSEVLGRPVSVEFVTVHEPETPLVEAEPADEQVRNVADFFGGRVVRRRKTDDG